MAEVAIVPEEPERLPDDPMIGMIKQVMQSPDMPVERVAQAFELYQKMRDDARDQQKHEAERAFARDFALMQGDMPAIKKKGKAHNSNYARWEDIMPEVQPVMAQHGFSLSFSPEVMDEGKKILIRATLRHKDGHFITSEGFPVPADKTGSKNEIQALGSSTSYAKRYVACALLNIVTGDDIDDDGQGAGGYITEEQQDELRKLADEKGIPASEVCARGPAESWDKIPAKRFDAIKALLQKAQVRS